MKSLSRFIAKQVSSALVCAVAWSLCLGAHAADPTPVCAAHWGKVVHDDFPWNHLDEVNQVLGLRGSGPDPVAFYVAQANRLKGKGL